MEEQTEAPQLVHLTVTQFVDALAGDQSAPGGGSASALAGALGGALAAMVAGLTLGREKYAAYRDEMATLREQAERLKAQLLGLVDADTAAYNRVTAAYGLPKQTEAQQGQRAAAVQAAMQEATQVPLATAEACVEVLELAAQAAAHGNRNAASDAAVAALLAHAGLRGAVRNVQINLGGLRDEGYRLSAGTRAAELLAAGDAVLARALAAADSGA